MAIGASEAEAFSKLNQGSGATWQRCRVHFGASGRQGRRVVSAFVATAFAQEDADSAKAQWRQVADQLRPKVPKLAVLMDEAEHDVLAT